jgi:hypothetical protein
VCGRYSSSDVARVRELAAGRDWMDMVRRGIGMDAASRPCTYVIRGMIYTAPTVVPCSVSPVVDDTPPR